MERVNITIGLAGLTMLGPRRILKRDGHLVATIPRRSRPPLPTSRR
jgi:hypothetical protein